MQSCRSLCRPLPKKLKLIYYNNTRRKRLDTGGTMSADHESNGRFKKGNKAASGNKEMREMRSATREEVVKCAYSLLRPWQTLTEETKDEGVSRYQFLVNKAVTEGNTKFITWVTEMAVGKPKQTIENEETDPQKVMTKLDPEQREKLINSMLEERKSKGV